MKSSDTQLILAPANELCILSAAELESAFAKGELSPVDVTRAAIERAEEINPALNAFMHIDADGALAAARASETRWKEKAPLSPIDGVPTTLKDIVHVRGWAVRYGSTTTSTAKLTADAPSVARLREAGAVFIGQTKMPEFGWKAVTDSPGYGITRNPLAMTLTPGGSSGGAAVASACGAGVLHLGTDGGGSIRIPAAFTGTFGLKPTFGRVPADPPSVFGTVAHIGPMTRRAADARAMLRTMSGRDLRDWNQPWGAMPDLAPERFDFRKARLGLWRKPPTGWVDCAIAEAFEKIVAKFEAAGAQIVDFNLPGEELHQVFLAHWLTGAANRLCAISPGERAQLDPDLAAAAGNGAELSASDLISAQIARATFGARMDQAFDTLDLIVSPACAVLPFTAGELVPPGSGLSSWTQWAGFSWPINLSQQPACSVPAGRVSGLPFGLQFVGPRGGDARVLNAAEAAETILNAS